MALLPERSWLPRRQPRWALAQELWLALLPERSWVLTRALGRTQLGGH